MTTADTPQSSPWALDYDVTADWLPYRHWQVSAEGEASARWQVSHATGIPVDELAAILGGAK